MNFEISFIDGAQILFDTQQWEEKYFPGATCITEWYIHSDCLDDGLWAGVYQYDIGEGFSREDHFDYRITKEMDETLPDDERGKIYIPIPRRKHIGDIQILEPCDMEKVALIKQGERNIIWRIKDTLVNGAKFEVQALLWAAQDKTAPAAERTALLYQALVSKYELKEGETEEERDQKIAEQMGFDKDTLLEIVKEWTTEETVEEINSTSPKSLPETSVSKELEEDAELMETDSFEETDILEEILDSEIESCDIESFEEYPDE